MADPKKMKQVISLIEHTAEEFGINDAYFVGGYPRTLAMGKPLADVHDLDVATGKPGRAKELAGFVAEAGKATDFHLLSRTNTVNITVNDIEVDFQGLVSHDDVRPYVRLWGVEETPIAMNIFDRDFTMNALAIKVGTNEILDMTKRGINDIKAQRVVATIPPEVSVPHDMLMITRAIRMAVKYGFEIDAALWKEMKKQAHLLQHKFSPERLSIEAYTLSKYPAAKGMIDALGITFLESPQMIEEGEKEAEG